MTRFIDSPALGSAGPLMKRVCYGLVLPGLIIGVTLYAHIPAKYGESSAPDGTLCHTVNAYITSLCPRSTRQPSFD